jgi:hypothetical protein
VKELTALKKMTYLDLTSTKVTDAELAELRKALPDCYIRPDRVAR